MMTAPFSRDGYSKWLNHWNLFHFLILEPFICSWRVTKSFCLSDIKNRPWRKLEALPESQKRHNILISEVQRRGPPPGMLVPLCTFCGIIAVMGYVLDLQCDRIKVMRGQGLMLSKCSLRCQCLWIINLSFHYRHAIMQDSVFPVAHSELEAGEYIVQR